MILTITGFHSLPFDRLIAAMDGIAANTDEQIIIQKGISNYPTCNSKTFQWLPEDEYQKLMAEARMIVCHAGIGTILDGKRLGKPVVVVPRRRDLGEHLDDHQTEICEALSESKGVICVADIDRLREILISHQFPNGITVNQKPNLLINAIRRIVEETVSRYCR